MAERITVSEKENLIIFIKRIVNEIFFGSLILYLIMFFLEEVKPNFVGNFLNMNYFLVLAITSGILAVLTKSDDLNKLDHLKKKLKNFDYIFAFILGIIGGTVTYYKITDGEAWLVAMMSLIVFVLIFLITLMFLDEHQNYE